MVFSVLLLLNKQVISQNNFAFSEVPIPFPTNETIEDIKVMDLNNDGADEIFISTDGYFVQNYVYRWYDGYFGLIWSYNIPFGVYNYGMQVNDFDNDGKDDLLISCLGPGNPYSVLFFKNYGDIFINQGIVLHLCPDENFCVHDLDGDGWNDLAVGSVYSNSGYSINLHRHIPDSYNVQFTGMVPDAVNGSNEVKAINLNNDDKMDIIGAEYYSGTVYTYRNDGDFNFDKTYSYQFSHRVGNIEVADFNNDGLDDFVAAEHQSHMLFFKNLGNGVFSPEFNNAQMAHWIETKAIDLNHDDLVDLMVAGYGSEIFYLQNNDDFSFSEWMYPTSDSNCLAMEIGDFNGDGVYDMVYGKNPAKIVFSVIDEFIPVGILEDQILQEKSILLLQNSPNPFNKSTTFQFNLGSATAGAFSLFDNSGRLIFKKNINAPQKILEITGGKLKSGIYYYQLKTNEGDVVTKKAVKY